MATSGGVRIPISLDVTDIKMGNIDLKDVEKSITARLSAITQGASQVLGKVDTSTLSKELLATYNELEKSVSRLSVAHAKYNDAIMAAGKSSLRYKADLKAVNQAITDQENIISTIKQYSGSRWQTAPNLLKQIQDAENEIARLKSTLPKPEDYVSTGTDTKIAQLFQAYQMLHNAILNAERQQTSWNNAMTQANSEAAKFLSTISTFKRIGSAIGAVTSKLASMLSHLKSIKRHGPSAVDSIDKSLKRSLKNITMYVFGFRSMYYLIKRLRTVLISGLNTMAVQFSAVNKDLTELSTSFNALKASLATAFQPILSYVVPVLKTLMNYLTAAMNAIGSFFAVLTGQGFIYKATAAEQDYADSLSSTASSAKEATKQLGAYDKLNVIHQDTDSGSGSGSGNTLSGITYDKASISDAISDFANMIKEAWKTADFTEVGAYIGEKLKGALTSANDWLMTDGRTYAEKIGKSLATLINGFVEVQGLGTMLGTTLANALNDALYFIYTFVTTLHWDSVGQFIADSINGFFETFDWATIGATLSDFVLGLMEALTTAIQQTDWISIGQDIGTVISNINWDAVLWDFAKLVGSIIAAIAQAIVGFTDTAPLVTAIVAVFGIAFAAINLVPVIAPLIANLSATLVGAIGLTVAEVTAVLGGIVLVIAGFVLAIGGFVDAVKNGASVIGGILTVLGVTIAAVGLAILGVIAWPAVLVAAIVAALVYIGIAIAQHWEEIKAWFAGVWSEIQYYLQVIGLTISGDIDGALDLINQHIKEKSEKAKDTVETNSKEAEESVTAHGHEMETSVNTTTTNMDNDTTRAFGNMSNTISTETSDASTSLSGNLGDMYSNLLNSYSDMEGATNTSFSNVQNTITTDVNNAKTDVSNIDWKFVGSLLGSDFNDGVQSTLSKLSETMRNCIQAAAEVAKSYYTSYYSIGTYVMSGFLAGMQSQSYAIISYVNSLASDIASTLSNALKVHSPSKVTQEIGKYTSEGLTIGIEKEGENTIKEVEKLSDTLTAGLSISTPDIAMGKILPSSSDFTKTLSASLDDTGILDAVTYLATILEDIRDNGNSSNNQDIVLKLDSKVLAKAVNSENAKRNKQLGYSY